MTEAQPTIHGSTDLEKLVSRSRLLGADKTLVVWDRETGRRLCSLEGHKHAVRAVTVTTDGQRAVSGSTDKTL